MAAVVLLLAVTLPPKPVVISAATVDQDLLHRTVRGAYHVHTTRSDGSEDRASIAAAAARVGLHFIIFTDHGDGTRPPLPPEYVNGVLCLDGVEVSTNGGHYVAIDMPLAPYPLGGDAAAVVEDVARLGGFGIAAHPHHPRPALAWSDWSAPIDGIEWINLDSEWRDEGPLRLVRAAFDYLLRPAAALAALLDRPVRTLDQLDSLERSRSVVGLAAADAHGGVHREGERRGSSPGVGPGYEASFRTVSNNVLLERPLNGDASADARLVVDAIRRGRIYSVVDGIATGVVLRRGADGRFEPASPLPEGVRVDRIDVSGRTRTEIAFPGAPGEPEVPWVLTNWSGERPLEPVPPLPERSHFQPLGLASPWRVEKDPSSSARVSTSTGATTVHYVLADGRRSQFVALAADLVPSPTYRALAFAGTAVKPMRVSVQLRFPDGSRWIKSVYMDPEPREFVIPVSELTGATPGVSAPDPSTATSVLFVVDLVNARPEDSGSFSVLSLRRSN